MVKLIKGIYQEFEKMVVALVEFDYEEALKEQERKSKSTN
ncbi:hypothetical protein AHA02nite_08440 [Alkalibacillus haloalkaliphilus]|uniref:Uncharacterized protein n=1 Tax=Alkalibacillus haloalkaliphilus TaxID=94136 RepID=A0A511W3Z7_9BACI|nr:hypothetical protein AHA02nite_08440 [Alkalibacillus haloalkaliphilus]